MGVPLRQSVKVGAYVARQKLAKRDKYPLIVELEPLFACNLECHGCGKIQYPTETLRKRLSVEQALAAMEECGAPMVSIAGGEPLLHPDIDKMTQALLDSKRFVYLCTNALLLERKLDKFKPHPAFSWVVHIDGLKDRHDKSVDRDGTFDKAVAAIKAAKAKGFRVATNTTFFSTDSPRTVQEVLD
ncbi:MAG TPA: adenosyl-hopene transferase HpnH, partial [Acidimicrobiales bacterium]|nr:adenosyl-hopene transferase HpnH [Acidimicrobiales bacterium]